MKEIKIITDSAGAAYIHELLGEFMQVHYSRIKSERPHHIDRIKDILKQIEDQVGGRPEFAEHT